MLRQLTFSSALFLALTISATGQVVVKRSPVWEGLITAAGLPGANPNVGEQEKLLRQALLEAEKLGSQQLGTTLDRLGDVLLRQNRYAEAEPLLRRSLALANNPGVGARLARTYLALG